MKSMQNSRSRVIAEVAIFAALAVVFDWLTLFKMPQGGAVTLSLVPILFVAYRHGVKAGMITGLIVGIVTFILNPYYLNPLQVFFDYFFAYTLVGLGGLFENQLKYALRRDATRQAMILISIGALLGGIGRFFGSFLAGGFFYGAFAPKGQNPWLYSLIYNVAYVIPQILLTIVVLIILLRVQPKMFK
ncbi:energy-coupled thiamine transporter ThiT [Leuconostoc pseudomesenteroides]|uniref:energy-coupled thiamine transporter ThiT n=2 Tax=Leuconostoc pseudomesenteroides TaxID=33968 RepID=UPI00345E8ED6